MGTVEACTPPLRVQQPKCVIASCQRQRGNPYSLLVQTVLRFGIPVLYPAAVFAVFLGIGAFFDSYDDLPLRAAVKRVFAYFSHAGGDRH